MKHRRSYHFRICWLAVAVAACAAFCGCGKSEKEAEPVITVQVSPAKSATISQVISAEAIVFPVEQATVSPKITSSVKQFFVQRGSAVKKGQQLAVLENADLSAAAEASKGDLDQAQATYTTTVGATLPQQIQKAETDAASAKSQVDAQQNVYDSRKQLFAQGAISRRDLDSAEVALVQARGQNEQAQRQIADLKRMGEQQALKAAEGQRLSAEGKYRNSEAQLSYSEIRSPIDGVVTDRPLFVGDLAVANQPLLTIMNVGKIIAKSHIPQAEASALKVGDEASISVPGVADSFKAKVTLVSPALDPGSTTVEVWATTDREHRELKPGASVQVYITAQTLKNAVVVPASAVFTETEGGGKYVCIAGSDSHLHFKSVKTGIRDDQSLQITDGVNPGDPIITSGCYGAPDKTQIKIAETPAAAPDKTDSESPAGGQEKGAAEPGSKEKE